MLKQLNQQNSFVIITIIHDLNLTSRYAERIWLIHQQKLCRAIASNAVLDACLIRHVWGCFPEKLHRSNGDSVFV